MYALGENSFCVPINHEKHEAQIFHRANRVPNLRLASEYKDEPWLKSNTMISGTKVGWPRSCLMILRTNGETMINECNPLLTLEKLKADLHLGKEVIQLNGHFQLTKTEFCYARAELLRDKALEKSAQSHLEGKTPLIKIMQRYQKYDSTLTDLSWPAHFPFHVISGTGAITSGSNIFMFFPQVLGIQGRSLNDYFGFELIDIWENIFKNNILPCIQRGFSNETQKMLAKSLFKDLRVTTYLASVLHEIGHRVGPWQISPCKKGFLKLDGLKLDVLGELSTDMLMISLIPEFPEFAHFIIFQRLFWFGRRGFRNNPFEGSINTDNDAWIGSYLWNQLWKSGVFSLRNQRIQYNFEKVTSMATKILAEIDELGKMMNGNQSSEEQEFIVYTWMKKSLEHNGRSFSIPNTFVQFLASCNDINESPTFNPIVKDDWCSDEISDQVGVAL